MLTINAHGHVVDARVRLAISPHIERGPMTHVAGVIVHQTGGGSAASALSSYQRATAAGAHFLIDRDGSIYQTASVYRQTWHVGRLKARCLLEKRCAPVELKAYRKFDPKGMHDKESKKAVPDRFPSNVDSLGIELVGDALPRGNGVPDDKKVYEPVVAAQNAALAWLVQALSSTLGIPASEVFRHPVVSWKNPSEARTAQW